MLCTVINTLWSILFIGIYIYFIILHIIMSPNIFNNWITPDMKTKKIIEEQSKHIKRLEKELSFVIEKISNED